MVCCWKQVAGLPDKCMKAYKRDQGDFRQVQGLFWHGLSLEFGCDQITWYQSNPWQCGRDKLEVQGWRLEVRQGMEMETWKMPRKVDIKATLDEIT